MSLTADDVSHAVLHEAGGVLEECQSIIRHCVGQLSEEQVWWRPHESMNSIGNLILHLTGNLRQWIVCGIGGKADARNRPAEFAARDSMPRAQLLAGLEECVREAQAALQRPTAAEMAADRRVQGFTVTGWKAVFDSIPHFKGHTQEIVGLTRMQLQDAYRFRWQPKSPEQGAAQG